MFITPQSPVISMLDSQFLACEPCFDLKRPCLCLCKEYNVIITYPFAIIVTNQVPFPFLLFRFH